MLDLAGWRPFFTYPTCHYRGELQNEEAAALGDKDHSSAGSAIDASRSGGITRIAANLEELG